MRRIFVCLVFLYSQAFAQSDKLGHVVFPNSGAEAAQPAFLEGILLLHSFEYDDAREAFQRAIKLDPDFAMAHWGEAMSHNHPIWMRQETEEGRAVLQRLGASAEARIAKGGTPLEKGFIKTLGILFGEGEKKDRDFAYAEAMRQLHEAFPGNHEAASFYALSLLGTCHDGRDFAVYMRAASIVEDVFAENPEHPGAAHYLIHSYDDPIHAPLGMRAAKVYAKIAPAASHALHMPSHIFVALGLWDRVAASNVDSWEAAEARVKRKNLGIEDRSYHALWWLSYARLQQGRYREAIDLLNTMHDDYKASPSSRTRYHLAAMRSAYLFETRHWDGPAAAIEMDLDGLRARAAAMELVARGVTALKEGNADRAEAALSALKEKLPSDLDAKPGAAWIMAEQLEGLINWHAGRHDAGLELLRRAARHEDDLAFAFGPPIPIKPAHELLGEILLATEKYEEAGKHFEKALERAPGRALSLLGLARAAKGAGDAEKSARIYAQLQRNWSNADKPLDMSAETAVMKSGD